MRRHHHAATDALAVQPFAIAQARFNRVAKGVTKIQDGPQARFALVLTDDPGLDLATALNGVGQRGRVFGQQRLKVDFQPAEKRHVGNRPVFDDFAQAGAQFTVRQGLERVQVANYQLRLVKRANHVFPQRMVDGRLAADRRIHLRQQRGGHLYERHAAHVTGGGKTRHVAHHAAAQGKQHGLAVAAVFKQRIKNQLQRGPVFINFAVGQRHLQHLGKVRLQRLHQWCRIQRGYGRIGHDQRRCGFGQVLVSERIGQQ